jgi:glycosyltransferase involved in cell wall biosynthesis
MNILEITPYEPPASGWVSRVKLLRRVIEERGGRCEILDIGPSRLLERPECISVKGGLDYLAKVLRFSRQGFVIHGHINGQYFRGLLLIIAALLLGRIFLNRCLVTFHGGSTQPFLLGWKRRAISPLFWLIFQLAHSCICNSEAEKKKLLGFTKGSKIYPIPAFSKQYLEYEEQNLGIPLDKFISDQSPIITTYLCFRNGFYTDVLIEAMEQVIKVWSNLGLVIVGTGAGQETFKQEVTARNIQKHIYIVGDLPHNQFMTLLSRSQVCLRTPTSDGVSATVLEALSLRVPVVASENERRPPSIITYTADDPESLVNVLDLTLKNYGETVDSIVPPDIADTARDEVDLILGINIPQGFAKENSTSFSRTGNKSIE